MSWRIQIYDREYKYLFVTDCSHILCMLHFVQQVFLFYVSMETMTVSLCYRVVELTGDVAPDMKAITHADLIVTTPEKWDGISRSWQTRGYVKAVQLLIIDEIHLLGM